MKGKLAKRRRAYRLAVSEATAATIALLAASGKTLEQHKSCDDLRYKNDRRTIDHIIPVAQGFKRNVDPLFMGSARNLRIVPLNYNIERAHRWDDDAQRAFADYNNK